MTLKSLTPKRCCLVVIDIQEKLMPVIHERQEVERNAVLLIKAAMVLGMPIIATTQYTARIGALLPQVTAELDNIPVIDKMEFDCFANASFLLALKSLPMEVNTVLACGVETHICIYQTMLGGLRAGYRMWVAADAVSSRTPLNHALGLDRIRQIGGTIGSTELIVYELLGRAGSQEFKDLLPFLK